MHPQLGVVGGVECRELPRFTELLRQACLTERNQSREPFVGIRRVITADIAATSESNGQANVNLPLDHEWIRPLHVNWPTVTLYW
jgi:hypothetical protein